MATLGLNDAQYKLFKFWLPALVNGGLVWLLFLILGDTPIIRASGLSLVIVGMTLALRRMGWMLAMLGGLTLALTPAFWAQTGGGEGNPATIVIALATAGIVMLTIIVLSQRPAIAMGIGIVIFVALFWSQIGTPRSLRLTGFIIGWLMFLLIDMLLLTNPRPDAAPLLLQDNPKNTDMPQKARAYHIYGILLLLGVGILNDPLLTLLAPSIALSLYLTNTRLPPWYWVVLTIIFGIGVRGLYVDYLQTQSYRLVLHEWRDAARWVEMGQLFIDQYGIIGILLAILGLSRFSRWYPPLGTVTLLAFAAYWFFGLVYIGSNRNILLLPMFVIFVLWMTYAVFTIGEWLKKSLGNDHPIGQYIVIAAYALMPMSFLLQIIMPA